MSNLVRGWVRRLQKYARRWWYAPLMGLLAAADSFVIVVPTDGLLVSATMLAPRRWLYTAFCVSFGSTVGGWLLALVLETHGWPFLLQIKPGIDTSTAWIWTDRLMDQWGLWALFFVAVTPVMQHPAIAMAAFAGIPLTEIFFVLLTGRSIKYLVLAWVSTHAPGLLSKMWGIQGDLEEAGVKTPPPVAAAADSATAKK